MNEIRAGRFTDRSGETSTAGPNDVRIAVQAGRHEILSDASVAEGGTDQGPNPHELLAASLAACTSMTVQMYANRKAWPLKSADVTVHLGKSDAKDANAKTMFDVVVSLQGELSGEQRDRLLDIANRCPVHKILAGPIQIKVSLV